MAAPSFSMKSARITKITPENYRVKTFEVSYDFKAKPGQFAMLWIPGIGEKPMSIGASNPIRFSIADVGPFSHAMHSLSVGSLLSFRGPLGTAFTLEKKSKSICVVGGGYGVVPLHFLAEEARDQKIKVTAIIGARTEKDIIYEHYFEQDGCEVHVSTDDGSKGFKGTSVALFEKLLTTHKFDAVYTCGPERMMHALALVCKEKKIPIQVSVERYMKCGIGICGSCDCSGKTLCTEGPIMSGEEALSLPDFGHVHRDSTGRKK